MEAISADSTLQSENTLLLGQKRVLEMVATGAPLADTLAELASFIEALEPRMRCGILIVTDDGAHFRRGTGASLPETYYSALDGVAITPPYFSPCGQAAHQRTAVVVPDIANDTRWPDLWRDLALSCGLKALRSTPVRGSDGRVLASFAMYYDQPRDPRPRDPQLIEIATHLAAIALERRRAEETVRQSERRFREVVEALPAAIYTTDAAGRITLYSPAAAELWGEHPEQAWCGSRRLYWPDGTPMPHDQCPMAVALKEDRPIRGAEAIAERPDGTRVPFLAYPTPLHDESGALVGAVNMLVDITERKAAEHVDQLLASIVESSDDAILSKDLNGIILTWNQGAERLFGYTPGEVIGEPITILIPPDRHGDEARILERIRRGERIDHYETVRRRKDGSPIEISLTVSPIRNGAGRIIGASKIARDITERKQAEEKAKLLAREVDHRARNMLATVQAIARMTRAESVPEFRDTLMGRLDALARAHAVLAESRWTGADLKRLAEEELAAYRIGDGGRVSIAGPRLALCPEAAQVLSMALHELATNAAKYGALSAPGGRIGLEWSWVPDERLVLRWIETGGPAVREPTRRGFGTRLIEGAVNGQLDGAVQLDWPAGGLACRMTMPRQKLLNGTGALSF